MKRSMITMVSLVALMFTAGMASADQFWGSASVAPSTTNGGAILFELDTETGTVGTTLVYSDWNLILDATCAPGNILYVVHNTTGSLANYYDFKLAKVNATTGAILSDTSVSTLTTTILLGSTNPEWNALEYHDGKLYAVENSWKEGSVDYDQRGYIYEVSLDGSGDPASVTLGAYIGGAPAPDGALAYKDGTWYASDWKTDHSSWIKTTTDIMNTNFTATVGTSPVGLIDGWDFEADGDLLGISWMANGSGPSADDFNVYKIDPVTGSATALFNIQSQLPVGINALSGLSAVPEPATMSLLALGGLALIRRRRTAK